MTLALQAQRDIKNSSFEKLVTKLQTNASIHERKTSRRESKKNSIALKVGKAFEPAQAGEPKDDMDETTILITRALRMTTHIRCLKEVYQYQGSKAICDQLHKKELPFCTTEKTVMHLRTSSFDVWGNHMHRKAFTVGGMGRLRSG